MEKTTTTSGFLDDIQQEIHLVPVSPGLRFANYIIDLIVFYGLLFLVGIVWGIIAVNGGTEPNFKMGMATQYILLIGLYVLYYIIGETASKGRTVGKLITGTMVVKEDGSSITFSDAILRTLARLIPFEPFSAFGYRPWHDSLTKTMVVKKQR